MWNFVRIALSVTAALLAFAAAPPAHAAGPNDNLVRASLLADADAAVPGGSFTLGVRLKIKSHWHTYWLNPGENGEATEVKLSGPAGFEFGAIQWPLPTRIEMDGGVSYGYEDEVLLMIPVKVSKDVPVGDRVTIHADAAWLTCKETCIPGQAKLTIDLPVRARAKPDSPELFAEWRQRLPLAKDAPAAAEAIAKVAQPAAADGQPSPALDVTWKVAPRKVEWFPVSTPAVAIEQVAVKHDGTRTRIDFAPKVFKADQIPGGRVDGLLVYEDAAGRRVGLPLGINVARPK
jgi:DsbC/DsbD-like thiol-disulfide interchange protein